MAPRRGAVLYTGSRDENKVCQLGAVVLTQQRGRFLLGHWPELSATVILVCPLSLLTILTVLPALVSHLLSQRLCTVEIGPCLSAKVKNGLVEVECMSLFLQMGLCLTVKKKKKIKCRVELKHRNGLVIAVPT